MPLTPAFHQKLAARGAKVAPEYDLLAKEKRHPFAGRRFQFQ